jgi:hypothetical protein
MMCDALLSSHNICLPAACYHVLCCCSPFNWGDENAATDMASMIQIDKDAVE